MSVLLIFLIVFIPLGLYIWRMLVFTKNTVGENSPFERVRTFSGQSLKGIYFDLMVTGYLSVISVFLIGVIFYAFQNTHQWIIPKPFAYLLLSGFTFFIAYVIIVQWVIIRDYRKFGPRYDFTFYPEDRSILLHQHNRIIRHEDIQKIEMVTNDHSKLLRYYIRYILNDGFSFIVVDYHPAASLLREFLKTDKVPFSYQVTNLPLIQRNRYRFLRQINTFLNRRFVPETIILSILLGLLFYISKDYSKETAFEKSLPAKEVEVVNGTIGSGKKGGKAYMISFLYEGRRYWKKVHRRDYFKALQTRKVSFLYSEQNDTFLVKGESYRHHLFLLWMLGIIAFFLTMRIIYLIVFPKTFH